MSRFKLVLLDVDGTTVASSGNALPSARVIQAIQNASQLLHVGLATGRPLHLSQLVIDALALKGLSIFNGGAEIIDTETGEILHQRYLESSTVQEIFHIANPFGYPLLVPDDSFGHALIEGESITAPSSKVLIEAVNQQDVIPLLQELIAVEGTIAHPTTSWEGEHVMDIHVNHEHATKRYGVEKLIEMLGISKDEVLAIGDGHNDLPLLEAAGFKVAMGNAPDEIKSIADYVAPSISDDGVADAIERFILS